MLIFNLKKIWYEKIKSGEKITEYREVKPYWTKRLSKYSFPCECQFRLGYTKEYLNAVINSIEVVSGIDTDLKVDKSVYAIHFVLNSKQENS